MHLSDIWSFLAGSTVIGIVAHAVNTFPTPNNKYGQWFLGTIQFIVGQRVQGAITVKGQDTVTFGTKEKS